jgi:hypothetical protein
MKLNNSKFIEGTVESLDITYLGAINFYNNLEDSIGSPKLLTKSEFSQDLEKIIKNIM